MKFMTKAEYERSRYGSSMYTTFERSIANKYHKVETPKVSIMDKIKIKLGLKPETGIKVRVVKDKVTKEINEWLERPEYYEEKIEKYGEEDIVLAGSLFVYMPQETTYLFSGSYTEFNKFYAPALLQKYVLLESI